MKNDLSLVVVLASVLKSVTDVRMYKKIALSLPENSEIHSIGSAINSDFLLNKNIKFYPIANFNRLSCKRFFYGFHFLQLLYQIKPNILIINTFELLPFAILYKVFNFFGIKKRKKIILVYDVMENYFQNIAYQTTYPKILRFPLAIIVRSIENISSLFINSFILAEQCYEKELNFIGQKYVILENKYINYSANIFKLSNKKDKLAEKIAKNKQIIFIHSGTISRTYGTLEAILFVKMFSKYYNNVKLVLIGFCSDKSYCMELQNMIKDFSKDENNYIGEKNIIDWQIMNDKPVAHEKILLAIANADFALLPYQINESNKNRIPTKFYEYIYHKIPMIVAKNKSWEEFCEKYDCAISYNFDELLEFENNEPKLGLNESNLFKKIVENNFYNKEFEENEILWTEKDKEKLSKILKQP